MCAAGRKLCLRFPSLLLQRIGGFAKRGLDGAGQRRGQEACPNSATLREDFFVESLEQVCAIAFNNIDDFVEQATAEARKSLDDNREQANKLRRQINDLKSEGTIGEVDA